MRSNLNRGITFLKNFCHQLKLPEVVIGEAQFKLLGLIKSYRSDLAEEYEKKDNKGRIDKKEKS